MRLHDRRKHPEHDHVSSRIKQAIVMTVCLVTMAYVATSCYMLVAGKPLEEPLERVITLLLGALIGTLAKLGADQMHPPTPTSETGTPIVTVEQPAGDPIPVTETPESDDAPTR